MAPAQPTELLTRVEVAEILRIAPGTLDAWARDGRIRSVRLPTGHRRFRRDDVEALLASGIEGGAA